MPFITALRQNIAGSNTLLPTLQMSQCVIYLSVLLVAEIAGASRWKLLACQ